MCVQGNIFSGSNCISSLLSLYQCHRVHFQQRAEIDTRFTKHKFDVLRFCQSCSTEMDPDQDFASKGDLREFNAVYEAKFRAHCSSNALMKNSASEHHQPLGILGSQFELDPCHSSLSQLYSFLFPEM